MNFSTTIPTTITTKFFVQASSHAAVVQAITEDQKTTIIKILKRQNYFLNQKLNNITSKISHVVDKINCSIETKYEENYKNLDKNILKKMSNVDISLKKLQNIVKNIKLEKDTIIEEYKQKYCILLSELETCQKQLNQCINESK